MEGPNGGMNDQEAQVFHSYFVRGLTVFGITAVLAHALTWAWRPWF
jgi:light-harvesting complex 1 beta chain